MRDPGNLLAVGLLLAGLVLIVATRRDFSEPQVRWPSGMGESPAPGAQSPELFKSVASREGDHLDARAPRGVPPFPYEDNADDQERAGREVKNPVPVSRASLVRGREVYVQFCGHCHGPRALGDGPVAKRAPLGMPLTGPRTRKRPDGELFHILTYGRLLMPSFSAQLSAEDRWRVIHYVRALQGEGPGPGDLDDSPADRLPSASLPAESTAEGSGS